MTFKIKQEEHGIKGAFSTEIRGKDWGVAFDRTILGAKQVALNAIKARVIIELIKQNNEIVPGVESDMLVMNNKNYLPDWKELNNKLVFDIQNG
jgi:cobalamin biosynthesis Co2+ chelatase CbiK